MSEVTIQMLDESSVCVTVTPESTCGEVIYKMLKDKEEEQNIERYRLVEVARSYDIGPPVETVLSIDQKVSGVLTRWDKYYRESELLNKDFGLKLVNLDDVVVINFNTYLRMTTGISEQNFKLFCNANTSVRDTLTATYKRLRVTPDPDKFGLFGAPLSGAAPAELEMGDTVLSLRKKHDTGETPSYFQFQLKQDLSKMMGHEKEGFLEKVGKSVKSWKTRWFVLKGSSLFYYKDAKDSEALGEVSSLDRATIQMVAPEKKGLLSKPRGNFFFTIELPDRTWKMAATDEATAQSWVDALRAAADRRLRDEAVSTGADKGRVNVKRIEGAAEALVKEATTVNVHVDGEIKDGVEYEEKVKALKEQAERERGEAIAAAAQFKKDSRPFAKMSKNTDDVELPDEADLEPDEAPDMGIAGSGAGAADTALFSKAFDEINPDDLLTRTASNASASIKPSAVQAVAKEDTVRPISISQFDNIADDLSKALAGLDDL